MKRFYILKRPCNWFEVRSFKFSFARTPNNMDEHGRESSISKLDRVKQHSNEREETRMPVHSLMKLENETALDSRNKQ